MDIITVVRMDLAGKPGRDVRAVAATAGVAYMTLRDIVRGRTSNPRYQTVEKLRAYYEAVKPIREARAVTVEAH